MNETIKFMMDTPYFDAYEKYKKSQVSFKIKKIYETKSTGKNVLVDIEFYDKFGDIINSTNIFV